MTMYSTNDTPEKQDAYIRHLNEGGFDYSLIVGEAFVRGMRDIGYKNTATAIDEIIDNSIEAGAETVLIVFGYDASSKKPTRLAIIDDGHGMSAAMLRVAVLWGGSHRQNSRELFGRYGFGLPSACVSQGKRFEVFSKLDGAEFQSITFDLTDIENGTFPRENGHLAVPKAHSASLPDWINAAIAESWGKEGLAHGTVVVMDKLDRLTWSTSDGLERNLVQHLGVTYRNFVRRVNLWVNDKQVEPVDPLFLDETAKFYAENAIRAEALPSTVVDVKNRDTGKSQGKVRVRYAYMKPGFQNANGRAIKGSPTNARFTVMKENNGLLVLRAGRQIDVVSNRCPWITFVNYDRNWKVELDFDPSLDEEFSITTSKQQVVLSDRMWQLLEQAGVRTTIDAMRARFQLDRHTAEVQEEQPSSATPRPSEAVMISARELAPPQPSVAPEERKSREEKLHEEVEQRAGMTGRSASEVTRDVAKEQEEKPYEVRFERAPEAPFYRAEAIGSQIRLFINESHPFFTDIYNAPGTPPRTRAALELLLLVMAECEVDARREVRQLYTRERQQWSRQLRGVLSLMATSQTDWAQGINT